jgi:hypothetical protein
VKGEGVFAQFRRPRVKGRGRIGEHTRPRVVLGATPGMIADPRDGEWNRRYLRADDAL